MVETRIQTAELPIDMSKQQNIEQIVQILLLFWSRETIGK